MTKLRALLGDYPHTSPLLRGEVSAPGIVFEFAHVGGRLPFKDFVRKNAFDIGELPLVPLLQARELGKPFWLLPVVLTARSQHGSLYVRGDSDLAPEKMNRRRIAIRSDANTGVAWALGILAEDYSIDLASLKLVAVEDNHIAEYVPPPSVEFAHGADIVQMLVDGKVDAIVTEVDLSGEPGVRPLIPDAVAAAQRWRERHGFLPTGHVVAISSKVAGKADLARQLFQLFAESKAAAPPNDIGLQGFDALAKPLASMIDYALRQHLIGRRLSIDEIYEDATRGL